LPRQVIEKESDVDAGPGKDERSHLDEDTPMDAQDAATILQEARDRATSELQVRQPVLFAVWGLCWFLSYGVIWLSVRGQRPYTGPTSAALLTLMLIAAAAYVITVVVVGRAASGVGGLSSIQRRILVLTYLGGYVGMFALEAAIDHAGASRAVLSVYGANAPILLIGLIVAASSALFLNWYSLGLGLWLLVLAAGSGFAGAVSVWAVDALAGGLAFLLLAAIGQRRRRA
jgi:hypothetical protein